MTPAPAARAWLVATIALSAASCSGETAAPRTQWLVEISTDAVVPRLGDRVLVEILDASGASACAGCRRVFEASAARLPLSFGITPDGTPERVRARLYRARAATAGGEPSGSALIDGTWRLPAPREVTRIGLRLAMACWGRPGDGDASCDPDTGTLGRAPEARDVTPLATGSWPGAARVPCARNVPPGMVCVPGGAFVLGDPQPLPHSSLGDSLPERLVRVSPFALDARETTVGEVRALRKQDPTIAAPVIAEGCTYLGDDVPDADALPASCVLHELAAAICAKRGLRLPTEAELEWAAGNLEEESPYPWGDDDDACSYAAIARGTSKFPSRCRATATGMLPAGPAPVGTLRDVTKLGIQDLGGNVSEWTSDAFAAYSDTCWTSLGPTPLDPRCPPSDGTEGTVAIRGGSWIGVPADARTAARRRGLLAQTDVATGFRCAVSMGAP